MEYTPQKHMAIISLIRKKYKEKYESNNHWTNKEIVRAWMLADSEDACLNALRGVEELRSTGLGKGKESLKRLFARAVRLKYYEMFKEPIDTLTDQQLLVHIVSHWDLDDLNLLSKVRQEELKCRAERP